MPTPTLAADLKALPELVEKLRFGAYTRVSDGVWLIEQDEFRLLVAATTRLGSVGKDLEIVAALQSEVAELHQYLSNFPIVTGNGRLKVRVQRLLKYFTARGKK